MWFIRISWLNINGTTYKKSGAVIVQMGLSPVFGKIHDLIIIENNTDNYFIVYEKLVTETFNHHVHAYEVSVPNVPIYICCKSSDLIDHHVLGIYEFSDSSYISVKYHIVENV